MHAARRQAEAKAFDDFEKKFKQDYACCGQLQRDSVLQEAWKQMIRMGIEDDQACDFITQIQIEIGSGPRTAEKRTKAALSFHARRDADSMAYFIASFRSGE